MRPRSTILQLLGYELRLARIGRLTQGVIVLAIATHLLGIEWDARKLALIAAAIAGGVALFVGILILQATLAFWTIESLEIANTLTYGGVEAAQYPLDIYSRWFRDFLIFVVPIGCVGDSPYRACAGTSSAAYRSRMAPRRGPTLRNYLSADSASLTGASARATTRQREPDACARLVG